MLPNGPFRLYVPGEAGVKKLMDQSSPGAGVPYWARLWPSAIALAAYLQKHPDVLTGRVVMELGAGLGLPSLVASGMADSVWCSDIDSGAMEIAGKSAGLNKLKNIRFETCNWNHLPAGFEADLVLMSDVNYDPNIFDRLEKVMHNILDKGFVLLLASPHRLMAKPFIERLMPFVSKQETAEVNLGPDCVPISIFTLQKSKWL